MSAWRTDKPTAKDGNIFVQFIDSEDGEEIVCVVSNGQLIDPIGGFRHSRPLSDVSKWCPLSEVKRLIEEAK